MSFLSIYFLFCLSIHSFCLTASINLLLFEDLSVKGCFASSGLLAASCLGLLESIFENSLSLVSTSILLICIWPSSFFLFLISIISELALLSLLSVVELFFSGDLCVFVLVILFKLAVFSRF